MIEVCLGCVYKMYNCWIIYWWYVGVKLKMSEVLGNSSILWCYRKMLMWKISYYYSLDKVWFIVIYLN